MLGLGELEQLDAALASLARAETALRLRLGQGLEVLGRGGHFELGFSSLAAYVLERCDRSVRWVEAARGLARRLEELPQLRGAMAFGSLSWSMGELLARVAQPQDEARWIDAAQSRTVRRMRALVLEALCAEHATGSPASGSDETCTLTCTVDQEEAWLFEATQTLLGHLGAHGTDAQIEALLAEGQGTLLAALPQGAADTERLSSMDTAQQRWLLQLSRWRAEAEALCEGHFRGVPLSGGKPLPVHGEVAIAAALGLAALESLSCRELDGLLRGLSRALAQHELELSSLVLQLHRAAAGGGWRRLGYATETQYARERLGMSRSSLAARRALALRLEKLPRVAEALGAGQLGVEAALQVVRVASPSTQAAWVARARQRTIKHLKEEVAAARVAVRLSGEANCPPPMDAEMAAFHELEQAVLRGRPCRHVRHVAELSVQGRRAWLVMLAGLARWLDSGFQMSAAGITASAGWSTGAGKPASGGSGAGRVTLRWRVSRSTHAWWRGLEAQARRWLPRGMSWLRFLCLSVWGAWRHVVGAGVAYGQIYIRDRYRCMSPVCSRKDVTPHHLQFRSAGGSDDDENVAAVCTWCHLFGVHGGRIRATGSAQRIRWELGALGRPCVVVHGRERCAA